MKLTAAEVKNLKTLSDKQLTKFGLDKKTLRELEIAASPIKWATKYLRNPENPREPLKLRAMQKELIGLKGRRIAIRASRRTGKSISVAIRILYNAITEENVPILVVTPYLSQIKEIFNDIELLISNSPEISEAVVRSVKSPVYEIQFANRSVVKGMCAGSTPGRRGSSLRGQGAKYIYVDEFDYMDEESLTALFMITKTRVDTELFVTSTPSGARSWFYKWCTEPKKYNFIAKHYGKEHIPNWTEEDEFLARTLYSESRYAHEVLAEFSDETTQVFSTQNIDQCVHWYNPDLLRHDSEKKYGIGVDWNSAETGCQIVILEYCNNVKPKETDKEFLNSVNRWRMDRNKENKEKLYEKLEWSYFSKKLRVFRRISVSGNPFVQHKAVEAIIACYQAYNPVFIYVDQGFGEAQVEIMLKWAQTNNDRTLPKILKACNFSGTIEIQDPMGPDKVKKRFKNYMVSTSQRYMEHMEMVMPMEDDEETLLVGQMRQYSVEKTSANGEHVYSKGNDHKLDALMLAILGFDYNFGLLTGKRDRSLYDVPIEVIPINVGERPMVSDIDNTVQKPQQKNPYIDPIERDDRVLFRNVNLPVPFRRWTP